MRTVFVHQDFSRVGYFKSILDEAGIPCLILNEFTHNSLTDLPSLLFFPTLCVLHDEDYDQAMRILGDYYQALPPTGENWHCPKCGEEVPANFDVCWKCGGERAPGEAQSNLLDAEDCGKPAPASSVPNPQTAGRGATKPQGCWIKLAWMVAAAVILWILWWLAGQVLLGLPGSADFLLRQAKYRAIVASAKQSFELDPGDSAGSAISGCPVWASRQPDGGWVITIMTKDWGHAGQFGYVYTDNVLDSVPADGFHPDRTLPVDGPMPLFVTGKIGEHWWTASNNWN